MKKVLFLMFLLFLMGLGAAGVKAQVRIGGNTPPSAAAVLDLNAGNDSIANIGTGGLVLPRVDLKSNVMQLTNGVANQTGTMVYNVTTTLGRIGVYYWNGNNWVLASMPSTSPADSGKVLMSNGYSWTTIGRTAPMTWTATVPNVVLNSAGYYSLTHAQLDPNSRCSSDMLYMSIIGSSVGSYITNNRGNGGSYLFYYLPLTANANLGTISFNIRCDMRY